MSTASTSALTALLSSLNNGSAGLDVNSAVASVISAESAPMTVWEDEQTTLSGETTSIQQVESEANDVTTALQSLQDVGGAFSSASATTSNPSVVSATAGIGAAAGTHSIVVNSLATTSSWYSATESSSTATLATGSFQLAANGNTTTFSTGSGTSGDTLADLATSINGANLGVTASVITDNSGSRLSIVSSTSGAAGNISISNDTGVNFTSSSSGADASFSVDGVPLTSSTNTVTNALQGVTLTLSGVSTPSSATSVTIAPDSSSIQTAVQSFVTAYNSLVTDLNGQFTFNSSTGAEGNLSSDSTVRSMQNDILSASNVTVGTGALSTLASLGVTTNNDGTLSLNTDTLDNALTSNYQGVVNFFQGDGTTPGYAATVIGTISNYTDPTSQGAFTVDLQSISNESSDLQTQIENFETYLESQQTVLTTEYNNANIALQQLPSTIKETQTLLGENNSSSN